MSMPALTALARHFALDHHERAQLLDQLSLELPSLPDAALHDAMAAAQATLQSMPLASVPRPPAVRCIGVICAREARFVTPSLCQMLGRSLQHSASAAAAPEAAAAAVSLQLSLRAAHEAAGGLLRAAPQLLSALLECVCLPLGPFLADAALDADDVRFAPICDLLRKLHELMPDWRSAPQQDAPCALDGRGAFPGEDAAVAQSLGRLGRALIAVCTAEFKRPRSCFVLMNAAWQLLVRVAGTPQLRGAACNPTPDCTELLASFPAQLQACVLSPLEAYVSGAAAGLMRTAAIATSTTGAGTASGPRSTDSVDSALKKARFMLGHMRAFSMAYASWTAREATRQSASALQLLKTLARLGAVLLAAPMAVLAAPKAADCAVAEAPSAAPAAAGPTPTMASPSSEFASFSRLRDGFSTCVLPLLADATQGVSAGMGGMTMLRGWTAIAEQVTKTAAADVENKSAANATHAEATSHAAANMALFFAHVLSLSAHPRMPPAFQQAAPALLLPVILQLVSRGYAAALLPYEAVLAASHSDLTSTGDALSSARPRPDALLPCKGPREGAILHALGQALVEYMARGAPPEARRDALVLLLDGALAARPLARTLAVDLWRRTVAALPAASAGEQLVVVWELATRLQSCEHALKQQQRLVHLLAASLALLSEAHIRRVMDVVGQQVLAARLSTAEAAAAPDSRCVAPLLVAMQLFRELHCLAGRAAASRIISSVRPSLEEWLGALLRAVEQASLPPSLATVLLGGVSSLLALLESAGFAQLEVVNHLAPTLLSRIAAGGETGAEAAVVAAPLVRFLQVEQRERISAGALRMAQNSAPSAAAMRILRLSRALLNVPLSPAAFDSLRQLCQSFGVATSSAYGGTRGTCWLAGLEAARLSRSFSQRAPEAQVRLLLAHLQEGGCAEQLHNFLELTHCSDADHGAHLGELLDEQALELLAHSHAGISLQTSGSTASGSRAAFVAPSSRFPQGPAPPPMKRPRTAPTSLSDGALSVLAIALEALRNHSSGDAGATEPISQLLSLLEAPSGGASTANNASSAQLARTLRVWFSPSREGAATGQGT